MDKIQLNKEIVLCRSIVKRAKVCTIRKLIKKIKILRSCKKEELREKKLRKGRRLAAEVHMMKTLRPDYVTKFALLTENYISSGSNTRLKRKRNACAKLVKHKDLVKRINSIREKFANWQEELPLLLKSTKKKETEDGETNLENKELTKVEESKGITVNEEMSNNVNERLNESENEELKSEDEFSKIITNKIKKPKLKNKTDIDTHINIKTENENRKDENKDNRINNNNNAKRRKNKTGGGSDDNELSNGNIKKKRKKKEDRGENEDDQLSTNDNNNVEEKVDDPFFIGKKVIVPKLLQKGNENHPENDVKEKERKVDEESIEKDFKSCHAPNDSEKPLAKKIREPLLQDELHPSWKAKKIQMIKPFQGKIIKFD